MLTNLLFKFGFAKIDINYYRGIFVHSYLTFQLVFSPTKFHLELQ